MKNYIAYLREMTGDKKVILNATAVVIVNDKNEVLLQKRADNYLWGLPGGILEMDESIAEGAKREVKEETNLDIEIERFIGVFTNPLMVWHETDKAKVYTFAFLARSTGGLLRVNDDESLELKYFKEKDVPKLHSVDIRQIVKAYYENKYNLVEEIDYNGN